MSARFPFLNFKYRRHRDAKRFMRLKVKERSRRRTALRLWICLQGLLLLPTAAWAESRTVAIPLTLPYSFIETVLEDDIFGGRGGKLLVRSPGQVLPPIELWAPEVGHKKNLLKIRVRVRVTPAELAGEDSYPRHWQGYLEVLQRVSMDARSWLLEVQTEESRLLDSSGKPTFVHDLLWNLLKAQAHKFLDQFHMDLSFPVEDLEDLLGEVFEPDIQEQVRGWLRTLRAGQLWLGPDALKVKVLLDVDLPSVPDTCEEEPPKPLSAKEIKQFIEYWELWDAFLVRELLSLSGRPLTQQDRDTLLVILLEQRYGFLEALKNPGRRRDLVRQQFLSTWAGLSPILRKYLLRKSSPSLYKYLAFLTALDAMQVLDSLGPALGLEVSQAGLARLARLVSRGEAPEPLRYRYGVDGELRKLLGLDATPPLSPVPARRQGDGSEQSPQGKSKHQGAPSWLVRFVASAWAEEQPNGVNSEIDRWIPPRKRSSTYLRRVRELVARTADTTLENSELHNSHAAFFRDLMAAVAWQESCWRQFVRRGDGVTYLRSYNGTSVGLMQVNERVWRGLYDPRKLRWSIRYNSSAGGEILELYLRRYALRLINPEDGNDRELLAGAVYAVYNGGPRQLKRYLKRFRDGRLYKADRLFGKKYEWVQAGKYAEVARCLPGLEHDPN
jgi:hypothetical protein